VSERILGANKGIEMTIDSIKNTATNKPTGHRAVNITENTYARMKVICAELQATHKAFMELAINNLIEEYERKNAE
jgi:CRISPR/Cas system-associated protein endoribonuclease Cas2